MGSGGARAFGSSVGLLVGNTSSWPSYFWGLECPKAGVDLLVSGVGARSCGSWLKVKRCLLSLCLTACGYSGCLGAMELVSVHCQARMVPDMVAVEFCMS